LQATKERFPGRSRNLGKKEKKIMPACKTLREGKDASKPLASERLAESRRGRNLPKEEEGQEG